MVLGVGEGLLSGVVVLSDFSITGLGTFGSSFLPKIADVFCACFLFTELGALPVKFFRVNFFFLFFRAHFYLPWYSLNVENFFSCSHNQVISIFSRNIKLLKYTIKFFSFTFDFIISTD